MCHCHRPFLLSYFKRYYLKVLKTKKEQADLIKANLNELASLCQHENYRTTIATYLDPRILYKFLLDNNLMEFEGTFFPGAYLRKHAWAHPNRYNYDSFLGYY